MSEFWSNFDAVPVGPMVTANKKLAWPGRTIVNELDPNGNFFSVVAGQGVYGGHCQRMHYLTGQVGTGTQTYEFGIGAESAPINVEFYLLFEPGFDFGAGGQGQPTGDAVGGKIGPRVFWGGSTTGFDVQSKWEAAPPFHFSFYAQRLATGAIVVNDDFSFHTATNQWYKFRYQIYGAGLSSYGKVWVDDVQYLDTGPLPWNVTAITDSVTLDFATFFGGANFASAPTVDCYTRIDRVHIWSGTGPGSSYPYYDQPST